MSWEMTLAVMLAITAGSAVFVAWPLLTGKTREEEFLGEDPTEPVLQRLLFRRDALQATMKELEFDLAMGNLSREDYEIIQERYRERSDSILSKIDAAKAGKLSPKMLRESEEDSDEESPVAVLAPRQKPGRIDLDVEQEIEAFRRKSRSTLVCPSCGHANKDPEAAFCSKCGGALQSSGQRRKKPGNPRGGRE